MVLVQAPDEASFPFMPRHTMQRDHVDAALPLSELVEAIGVLAEGRVYESRSS